MRRGALLVLTLLLGLSATMLGAEPPLPVPPIPPLRPPSQDAPVPDMDARVPPSADLPSSLTLDTDINRRGAPNTSLGYAPGSRYRVDDTRRPLAVPGLQWHMPFQ